MNGCRTFVFRAVLAALLLAAMTNVTFARSGAPRDEIPVDLAAEIDKVANIPERFAVEVPYRFGVQSRGTWTATGNVHTWSYEVSVPGAVSLSFHAGHAVLPSGATLIVSGGGSEYRYASRDVHRGELWSRIARGDTLTFTLTVGAADANAVVLDVVGVQAGFRSLGKGGSNNAHFDEIQRRVAASASTADLIR